MRAAVPHAAPRLPARTRRYGCALWCYIHGLDVLCGCLRFVRLRLTALGALARTSCGRCAARQTRRSLRFYVSGRASCCAKRRRSLRFYNFRRALCCAAAAAAAFASLRFYNFRRALCCAAVAALGALAALTTPGGRLLLGSGGARFASTTSGGRCAARQRQRSLHFSDFGRALCCSRRAALASLPRLRAGVLLLGSSGARFAPTSSCGRCAARRRRALRFYD